MDMETYLKKVVLAQANEKIAQLAGDLHKKNETLEHRVANLERQVKLLTKRLDLASAPEKTAPAARPGAPRRRSRSA